MSREDLTCAYSGMAGGSPVIPLLLGGFFGQLWRLLTPDRLGITNILNKQLAELRGALCAPG